MHLFLFALIQAVRASQHRVVRCNHSLSVCFVLSFFCFKFRYTEIKSEWKLIAVTQKNTTLKYNSLNQLNFFFCFLCEISSKISNCTNENRTILYAFLSSNANYLQRAGIFIPIVWNRENLEIAFSKHLMIFWPINAIHNSNVKFFKWIGQEYTFFIIFKKIIKSA